MGGAASASGTGHVRAVRSAPTTHYSPFTTRRSVFFTRSRSRAGFSLIEILIAMFVFLVGLLGVLSIFPVAMNSASKSVGQVRANILAETALAQLAADCTVPYVEGDISVVGTDTLTPTDAPTAGEWLGYFCTIRSDTKGTWQSRIIVGNDGTRLTVCPPWNPEPVAGDAFIITRMGLPSLPRGVVDLDGIAPDTSVSSIVAATPGLTWDEDEWNGFYVLMLDGARKGEFRAIADTTSPRILTLASPFVLAPANGDTFAITRSVPHRLHRGTTAGAAGTAFTGSGETWQADEWNEFYLEMASGSQMRRTRLISDTANPDPDDLTLASAFSIDPSADDFFDIVNHASRTGYIREFSKSDEFRAGFATLPDPSASEPNDLIVRPLTWPASWYEGPVTSDTCTSPSAASTLAVVNTAGIQAGHLAVIRSGRAAGQVRIITDVSANPISVFPPWAEDDGESSIFPLSGDDYEICKRLGYFVVITSGQAAGRVFPITAHTPNTTDGDEIECKGVDFRDLRICAAKSGSQYKVRDADGFMIVGADWFVSTLAPHAAVGAVPLDSDAESDDDYGYLLNTLGLTKTAEPQTGFDAYYNGTVWREASEYSSVYIFSDDLALPEAPVRVDIIVFKNFDRAQPLQDNRSPVGHMTGYIGRP